MDFSFNPYNILTTTMKSVVLFPPFDKGTASTERLSNMFQDTQQISDTTGIYSGDVTPEYSIII